ncbi:uncharacterized protein N0V89_007353 [Didymosphaeria variabile]|uniref:BTB domain-containing protein n=1 Tax=Didymosphaeria variabile TaxID=1932322 RepID=A0A9W8XJF9_9PLEO|nr:uncharacterized protein N0V89_007353 [Didymosphaeria variabile]KAJ4352007.1 hypothetical protein N0V89_007353 [Didymosphaeria variabile]
MARKRGYDEFMQSMKSLLETGKHSDFKITCGNKTWDVHKAIVCSQSDFFDAATRFGGKKEATEGVLNLPNDDPDIVGCMIQFMYELDYQLPSDKDPGPWWIRMDWRKVGDSPCPDMLAGILKKAWDMSCWKVSAKHMTALAEKHPSLKDKFKFKVIKLEFSLDSIAVMRSIFELYAQWKKDTPDSYAPPINHRDAIIHANVYAIADKYGLLGLKQMVAFKFEESLKLLPPGEEFFEAVTVAFTTTPDTDTTLRNIIAKHVYEEKTISGLYEELDVGMKTTPGLLSNSVQHTGNTIFEPGKEGSHYQGSGSGSGDKEEGNAQTKETSGEAKKDEIAKESS